MAAASRLPGPEQDPLLTRSNPTKPVESQRPIEPLKDDGLGSLIEDEASYYCRLRDHFLREGPGQRPNLPSIPVMTNILLLRLGQMKEKGNCSFLDLKGWLVKLFPDTRTVSASRIEHRIKTLRKTCTNLSRTEAVDYLNQEYNFHALPPPLASLGLDRRHLLDIEPFLSPQVSELCNETISALESFRAQEQLPHSFVYKWFQLHN